MTDGPPLVPIIHYLEAMGLSFLYSLAWGGIPLLTVTFLPSLSRAQLKCHLSGGLLNSCLTFKEAERGGAAFFV